MIDSVEVKKAIAQCMIMMIAIDGKITQDENKMLISLIKKSWKDEYSNIVGSLETAKKEITMWKSLNVGIEKQSEKCAKLIAKECNHKQQKIFLSIMTSLIKADGRIDREETALYAKIRTIIEPDKGFLGSIKKKVDSVFHYECPSCKSTKTKLLVTKKYQCEECGHTFYKNIL